VVLVELFMLLVVVAAATAGSWQAWRKRKETGLAEAYDLVREAGLPNETDRVMAAARRFEQRHTVFTIGGWFGCALGLISFVYAGVGLTGLVWWGLVGTFGAGVAICVLRFRAVRSARTDGPRTASLRQRRLSDFLVWPEIVIQYGVLVLPLASVALGVLVLTGDEEPRRGWLLVAAGALSLLIYVAATILQRRVLGLNQVASEESELRWEEALRASTLRDLADVMMLTCWLMGGVVAVSFDWPDGLPSFVQPVTYVLFGGGIVAMGVAKLMSGTKWGLRRSQRVIG
jgi:hypothetical protein